MLRDPAGAEEARNVTRLLVTGGSSYLGQHLLDAADRAGYDVLYTYFNHRITAPGMGRQLDVRDGVAVRRLVADFGPEVIIHTAGSNRPAETMDAVIRQGAANVRAAAAACGARLVHISTDVVFDGQQAPYSENDPPSPIHDYGRAKAAAEQEVRRYEDHVVVRTSLIYGLERMDRGTRWIAEGLRAGKRVTLFVDQMRNPVWVQSLSHACLELAGLEYRGILHVAGAQRLSRAEFGLRMLDWWQIEARETLSFGPCDGERWPLDCTLDISRAGDLLQTSLPGVDDVLEQNLHK
ncbi:MAG TPA: SDR family oxidoreductase [Candidatus Sulfomarinibacteraceae bacterium]|nr:SDR family oxidoreductase [Candidatus Sulfomarinibacteraceae bacterium]